MIYLFGDIHANWKLFNENLIKIHENEEKNIVIVCGDFGYWPKFEKYSLKNILNFDNIEIYFCPGNHEDWNSLHELENGTNIINVKNKIFYCPKGSVKNIDNKNILFMGGANSIDKHVRTPMLDWFPDEIISESDIYKLPDTKIDIVVSHTCPEYVFPLIKVNLFFDCKDYDPSRFALNHVFDTYKPKEWYFAHFHIYTSFMYKNCKFFCLSNIESKKNYLKSKKSF